MAQVVFKANLRELHRPPPEPEVEERPLAFYAGYERDRSPNRQLRTAIKTRGHFPNEEAAKKLIHLAITNAASAWTRTRNWTTALLAFRIHFGDRLPE